MMKTLRGRFILSHLLPILIVTPLFAAGLIYILETQVLLAELSKDVDERATLIAEAVNRQPSVFEDPKLASEFVTTIGLIVPGRILLVGAEGQLLATDDPDLIGRVGSDVIDQAEGIQEALAGESSVLVYYEVTNQRGEAFVPVRDVNEQLIGIVGVTDSLTGIANQFGKLRWLVLLALSAEVVLAVILALYLSRRLARPITAVSEAVAEIASGERVEPLAEEGPVEIRQLAASVNFLAERLRSLEENRRRLLANLVHELGRPLGAIRAAIHTLRQEAGEDPDVRAELLEGVEDEVIRMQPLLDDLAQLHGQILGLLELNRQPIKVGEWLPPVLLPWRASALEKGLAWQATIPEDLPECEMDPDRIRQALGNLLSNAVKYTPKEGSVTVTAGWSDNELWIEVKDTGPGIVIDEQEKVFDAFFRSRQQRRFPQGLGLGLNIARDLIQAHGGRLELDSTPGQGSCFTVSLPCSQGF